VEVAVEKLVKLKDFKLGKLWIEMKRGSIFFVTLVMLLGAIVLLLLIGKLGINGYASYDWKFENLAMQKGVTGNSVFDWFKELFGVQTSPTQTANSYFDDYTDNITSNLGINQSSIVNVVWDGISAYKPVVGSATEVIPDGSTTLLMHMNKNVNDSSGNGNNGAITGNVNCSVSGKFNQGCGFDGDGDGITTPGDLIGGLNQVTISVWARASTLVGLANDKYLASSGSNVLYFRLGTSGGNAGKVYFYLYNNSGITFEAQSNTNLMDTNWHHYVGVLNGSTVLLYVDGEEQNVKANFNGKIQTTASSFIVGLYASGLRSWNGTIDEVVVYNRSLTLQEIQQLYSNGGGAVSGTFKSNLIDLGGSYNALRGEWSESNNGVTQIQISKDGNNWCALSNGTQVTEAICSQQLPASNLIYRATFNDATNLDWINFSWSTVSCLDDDIDDYSTLGGGSCCGIGGNNPCNIEVDCRDDIFGVHPGAVEICGDGLDNDCTNGDLTCVAPSTIYVDNNLTGNCLSGNYNIATRQCNGNDGIKFDTLQEAANNVSAGDSVLVRNGTYFEEVKIERSGFAGSPIIFKNYGNEHPVIDANMTRERCIFVGKAQSPGGGNFVIIDGFVCKNPKFITGSSAGILVYGTKNVTIRNNIVLGFSDKNGFATKVNAPGIFVQGPNEDTIVEYNYVIRSTSTSIGSRGTPLGDWPGNPQRPVFRYNHVSHCAIYCDPTSLDYQSCLDQGQNNAFGMPLREITKNGIVEQNIAHHCDDGGFGENDCGSHIFRDNIAYKGNAFYGPNGNGPGIKMKPSNRGSDPEELRGNNTVYNNIAFMNWASGFEINSWTEVGFGSRVFNNIAWWNGITGFTATGINITRPEQHNVFMNNIALNNSKVFYGRVDFEYNGNDIENDYNFAGDGRFIAGNSRSLSGDPQLSNLNLLMIDANGDGVGNACDICSDNGLNIDHLNDIDGDGTCGSVDNCPLNFNPLQEDCDGNGIGNACDGSSCSSGMDSDGDGVKDNVDNCINAANPVHIVPFDCNIDGDTIDRDEGIGAQCDRDRDKIGDAVCGNIDNCLFKFNSGQEDSDGDGTGNACDSDNSMDADSDGVLDYLDNCPYVSNPGQEDTDADGTPDILDPLDDPFAYPSVFPDPYNVSSHIAYAQQQMKNVFSLNSSSPLIDAGTLISGYHCPVSGVDDGNGCRVWYGNAPDIGAYEYNSGTAGCMTQGQLNTEIQKFVNAQIGIVDVTNKVVSYLGC